MLATAWRRGLAHRVRRGGLCCSIKFPTASISRQCSPASTLSLCRRLTRSDRKSWTLFRRFSTSDSREAQHEESSLQPTDNRLRPRLPPPRREVVRTRGRQGLSDYALRGAGVAGSYGERTRTGRH